ncbi:hypothetical protein MVEN_00706400 [Mycena venus]|uniref:Uncharacterized protein n=1 Tax=Mycena venus TaxID=2733690 RepID=A0A8H6YJN4_9AGAR|nr:hypothetical protein MVEN_00706400 [Mycena venus]
MAACYDNTMVLTSSPLLPPELERTIFEIRALARPASIPVLMLVAARVKEWVEPLLYRVVYCVHATPLLPPAQLCGFPIFSAELLLRIIEDKPHDFLQRSVRHLFVENIPPTAVESILRACNHVTNVFEYFTPTPHPRTLRALQHLRRLTIGLPQFLQRFTLDDNAAEVFQKITHLELMDTYNDATIEDLCVRLRFMQHLTHVAVNSFSNDVLLYNTFRSQQNLQCIVILIQNPVKTVDTHALTDDDRFVCIHQQTSYRVDWLRGADTGEDSWALADAFIAARRAGKVDASRYIISNTDLDESWST